MPTFLYIGLQIKTSMNQFFKSIGILTTVAVLAIGMYFLYENFSTYIDPVLKFVGFLTLVLMIVALIAWKSYGKNWLIKLGVVGIAGNDLVGASKKLVQEAEGGKVSAQTQIELGAQIFKRLTRLGLIGLIIAILPVWLLWQQNQLFRYQNTRVDEQTNLLRTQNEKLEAQNDLFKRQNILFTDQNQKVEDVLTVGAGWFTVKTDQQLVYHHGGDIAGFTSFLLIHPESNGLIILLSNEEGKGEQRNQVMETILKNEF